MSTKWAFEVPMYHLEDFQDLQDSNFCLAHLCKDKKYVKFFRNSPLVTTLDNSYNEEGKPTSVTSLVRIAEELEAYTIVSPDSHLWGLGEALTAFESLQKVIGDKDFTISYVIHSAREYEIAKYAGSKFTAAPGRWRSSMPTRVLHVVDHFLGFNNPLEVRTFHPASVDTGMPIKLALQGKTLDSWLRESCPHIHNKDFKDYFFLKMSLPQIRLARKNILRLKEVCNER